MRLSVNLAIVLSHACYIQQRYDKVVSGSVFSFEVLMNIQKNVFRDCKFCQREMLKYVNQTQLKQRNDFDFVEVCSIDD